MIAMQHPHRSRGAVPVALALSLLAPAVARPALAATAPQKKTAAASFPVMQRRFEQFVRRYVDDAFAFYPPRATEAGVHAYDAKLPDLSAASIAARAKRIRAAQAALKQIDPRQLDAAHKIDYELYRLRVDGDLYELTVERGFEKNPGAYNFGFAIDPLISQQFAPPEARLRSIVGRLHAVPRYLEQARRNLKHPPKEFTQFAIEDFPGAVSYIQETVPRAFAEVKDSTLWREFDGALAAAKTASDGYVAWMRDSLLARSDGSFVLGEERYRKKLHYEEMVDTPIDSLLEIGTHEMDRLQARFRACAAKLVPSGSIDDALKLVRPHHPPKDSLLAAATALLEMQRAFSISSGFLAMPSEERCTVRPTPEFAANRSFASLDAPGPLETKGRRGYYNISLPGADWDSARTEEYLQGFNRGSLSSVSFHEAYPGHYGHYLYSRDAGSLARKTTGCGSFAEGWALYCEESMFDMGYGKDDPELEFGMLRWALVRACRFQVGLRVHTKGMTIDEATKYFVEHAGMEPVNAQREAFRAVFDPTYIIYTLGALQIRKLRDDLKREQGDAFDLGKFHATILSQGSVPVALLRQLLLKNEGPSL